MVGQNILDAVGVELSRSATNALSTAVSDYGSGDIGTAVFDSLAAAIKTGNIDNLTGGIEQLGRDTLQDAIYGKDSTEWQSPKYASDLIAYAPKSKFLFKVHFVFNPEFAELASQFKEFEYVVKSCDKPKVQFEYDEVNMYNFRTKVLRSIKHDPISLQFHDDIQNKVQQFFNVYRTAMSPVSNLDVNQKNTLEDIGMKFEIPGSGQFGSGNSGVLLGDAKNILSHVKLTQVFGHGTRKNEFTFMNPKIESFGFDGVTHDDSDGNVLDMTFSFDSMHFKEDITTGTPSPQWGLSDIIGNVPEGQAQRQGISTNPGIDKIPIFNEIAGVATTLFSDSDSVYSSATSAYGIQASNTLSKLGSTVVQGAAGLAVSKLVKLI